MPEEKSIWDSLGGLLEAGIGGYFDREVSQNQAEALKESRKAEELRAQMIDQLSRQYTLGTNAVGNYVSGLPSWVLPAVILGFGGIIVYKFVK